MAKDVVRTCALGVRPLTVPGKDTEENSDE